MDLLIIILKLLFGGLLLSWGANQFVDSSSHIARRFGISPVVIGLTVVAFGTSAPELFVNLIAVGKGNTELAIGNVVGSNIFNIAFILGICSLIKPLYVSSQLIKLDIPLMCLASFLLWLFSNDLKIELFEGLILFLGIIIYTFIQVRLVFKNKEANKQFEAEYSSKGNSAKDLLHLVIGLSCLVFGANLFVDGAVSMARLWGISEAIIGLTIIAAGTSLPEVATSIAATIKGERDIAIGNVVGSNMFNILGVVGLSALISPKGLPVGDHMARIDTLVMFLVALTCLPFCMWRKQLDRPLGLFFFLFWIAYTIYLI